jgi:DNA primase small subunit
LNPRTLAFLKSKFREYYLEASIEMPPGFQEREWGFLLFDQGGMRRHKAFPSRSELVSYIRAVTPAHVYHSAAYYQHPGAPTMKEKGWRGADLIFDLDADHLKRAPKSYSEMLELVKKETMKLLDFLTSDFGFSEDGIEVVFSGGRGYHIHVRDSRVLGLGSDARREIVDYLTGRGLDLERLISKRKITGDHGVEKALVLRCPPRNSPGWGGRINSAVRLFVDDISRLGMEEAIKRLSSIKGIGDKTAENFYRYIMEDKTHFQIEEGNLDGFNRVQGIWGYIIDNYLAGQFIQIAGGETDEPVTADIKRLIRFPHSLHGGSGFRVTPLTLDGLKDFQPLKDAVVFGREPVLVNLNRPFRLELLDEAYDLDQGSIELPAFAAIFLMARGLADLGQRF